MERLFAVCLVMLLILTAPCLAGTWYVTPDGTGDVPTIQAAVDSVAPGDTVLLASGTYTGSGSHNVVVPARPFLLTSATGDPADCIIDCEGHLGSGRWGFDFLSYWTEPIVVRGITIRNANSGGVGGAVSCRGSVRIRDCIFESNVASEGGGAIGLDDAEQQFVLKNCTFISNEAVGSAPGGAIMISGVAWLEVAVDSCTFYDNQAGAGGAIHLPYHEVFIDILNCLFIENSALSHGGAVAVENIQYALVENCTFHGNHAPTGSAIYTLNHSYGLSIAQVRKCIIAYGTGGEGYYQEDWVPEDQNPQCTDIFGNEGGDWVGMLATRLGVDGNFSACPAFCNAEMVPHGLSLCEGSPCLPGSHPDGYNCGLIGALGQGCVCGPTATERSTWGAIKSMYR